jgi:hypothetical protein
MKTLFGPKQLSFLNMPCLLVAGCLAHIIAQTPASEAKKGSIEEDWGHIYDPRTARKVVAKHLRAILPARRIGR